MNDQELKIKNFSQTWPKPSKNNPIVIIGTGGIVKDAHLPAYKKAGFEVIGLYDVDKQKAVETNGNGTSGYVVKEGANKGKILAHNSTKSTNNW